MVSCQEPRLKSEVSEGEEEMTEAVSGEVIDPVERRRRAVIGRTFATLTLGTRKFVEAEVLEITDGVIVVRHSGGEDRVPWSEVPAEVCEEWGFDPSVTVAGLVVEKIIEKLAPEKAPAKDETVVSERTPEMNPELNLQKRSREIAGIEEMLAAQLEGFRVLESDFSRHSLALQNLQVQLQSIRARQAGAGKRGVRVERIGGESTVVDRRKEAAALEARIRVEAPLVAPLFVSL